MKRQFKKQILLNLTFALITIIYFIVFSTQYNKLEASLLNKYVDASSMLFLGIAIAMLEIAYKKSDEIIFLHGLEFTTIAIFTLLIKHMPKMLNCSIDIYTLVGANLFALYYILKSIILYTKQNKYELNSLSDIREIVKDEPIKKETKRKNKKEEEGK